MASKTFTLNSSLKFEKVHDRTFMDFEDLLYQTNPVSQHGGRVLVRTDPEQNGGKCIHPGFGNGFVGCFYKAYNEHRHLIIRPDDVWIAITTAFGLYMNGETDGKKNAEEMRKHFVDFEDKIELVVTDGGTIYSVDWSDLIARMSDLIEKNTKDDARKWIEPDFSTTTPVCKTVGQVVLMGVMKNYFDYKFCLLCGLPKVTLEGTLEDWQKLKDKATRLGSYGVDCLSHWAKLLDYVLDKLIESYNGKVDEGFWSKIACHEGWGSGPRYIAGWINVFMPFDDKGTYRLRDVKPESGEWGKTDHNDVPPSTVEVPVKIDDNGVEYETIFYGGHITCVYDEKNNSLRPSLDWAIVDVTGKQLNTDGYRRRQEPVQRGEKAKKFYYGA